MLTKHEVDVLTGLQDIIEAFYSLKWVKVEELEKMPHIWDVCDNLQEAVLEAERTGHLREALRLTDKEGRFEDDEAVANREKNLLGSLKDFASELEGLRVDRSDMEVLRKIVQLAQRSSAHPPFFEMDKINLKIALLCLLDLDELRGQEDR